MLTSIWNRLRTILPNLRSSGIDDPEAQEESATGLLDEEDTVDSSVYFGFYLGPEDNNLVEFDCSPGEDAVIQIFLFLYQLKDTELGKILLNFLIEHQKTSPEQEYTIKKAIVLLYKKLEQEGPDAPYIPPINVFKEPPSEYE